MSENQKDLELKNQEQTSSEQNNENTDASKVREPYPWTAKRFIACLAIILLVGLYLFVLIAAFFTDRDNTGLFRFALGMTVAVPLFAWILIYAIGYFGRKHTIASLDVLNSNPEERKKMEEALQRERAAASKDKTAETSETKK